MVFSFIVIHDQQFAEGRNKDFLLQSSSITYMEYSFSIYRHFGVIAILF